MTMKKSSDKIKVAVITGHHPYDVVGFQTLFRNLPGIDAYPQNIEDFVTDTGESRGTYEALVFYNYHLPTPGSEQYPMGGSVMEALTTLGDSKQGIFLLHHAILAYPEWPQWQEISGGIHLAEDGPVHQDQVVQIRNVSPRHPITQNLQDFDVIDETYGANNAENNSEILLTTDHSESMKTMAWTRQYKNARVFCYQSGHDRAVFNNEGFQTVLMRGIQWCAGRI